MDELAFKIVISILGGLAVALVIAVIILITYIFLNLITFILIVF